MTKKTKGTHIWNGIKNKWTQCYIEGKNGYSTYSMKSFSNVINQSVINSGGDPEINFNEEIGLLEKVLKINPNHNLIIELTSMQTEWSSS